MRINILFILLAISMIGRSQQPLTSQMIEESAFRFSLNAENQLEGEAREKWLNWVGDNQYVGLAEVHNSAQLSFFTKALLNVLDEKGFEHFAIEMGPNSAGILQEITENSDETLNGIKELNRKYGKKGQSKTPMIFANKIEDAVFVEEAARLGFTFWGLDQEFAYSHEMLIDHLHANSGLQNEAYKQAYQEAKSTIKKVIYKNKYKGQYIDCWYPESKALNHFFSFLEDSTSQKIISDLKTSWDIYCKSATGQGSNQQRADYMKQNFEKYLDQHGPKSKVFLKLGGIHLTHGLSHFRVNDMGKFLTEKAASNNTELLNIRHLITYRNGKSNVGKAAWKNTSLFLEVGSKDQWTVVDLRPLREKLQRGEITTTKSYAFELMSYDLLLISPDDQYPKVNY
ncbi:hypothetical protein [Ekhidna sp.]|uniref:hypothetical protein n=1 Tax=Ekhidna sp. TaxID=2608089 RepID=UPI003CCC0D0A